MSSNSGSVAAVAAVNGECCLINHRPCLIAPQRACEIFRPLSAMTFQDGREIFRHLGALPFLGPHRFSPAGCPGRGGGDRGGGRRGAQRHRDNPGPFHQRLLRAARRAHTAHGGERSGHVGAPAMRVAWRARREPLKKGVVEVWGKPTAEEAGGALSDAMKTPQPFASPSVGQPSSDRAKAAAKFVWVMQVFRSEWKSEVPGSKRGPRSLQSTRVRASCTCDRKQSLGPFRFQRCSTPLLDAVDADAVDAVDPVDTAFEVFVLPTAMARSTRGCSLAGAELPQPMENPLRQVGAGNPEFGAA